MLIVNYFPGSYGDRYICKISGVEPELDKHGHTKNNYNHILKLPSFYTGDNKQKILQDLSTTHSIIGAHRLLGYNFEQFDVVSIDPRSCLEMVAKRYWYQLENKLITPHKHSHVIDKVLEKHPKEVLLPMLTKEINEWCDSNILENDKIVSLDGLV